VRAKKMALSGYGPHAGKEISKAGTQEKKKSSTN
jgi:hypothetical protein